jgi:GDSL-like lipase/acylhydrolase family protein
LALGDSILCGPEEGAFGVPPRSWAQWLAEALDLPFHKLAQPGATTPWIADALLPRARDDYALACVGVGTNDVRSLDWDPRPFEVALGQILDGLAERAARICLATVPLDLGRPPAGAKVGELNAIVRAAATARNVVVVVDLDDLRGWRHFFPDAVHPTALGQLEIAQRAATALELDVSPMALTSVQRGVRADARYAGTRQVAHLLRDWRRRAIERNV